MHRRLLGRVAVVNLLAIVTLVAASAPIAAQSPSASEGTHWKELDSTAGGLLVPPHPVPTKASVCPADLQGRSDKYIVRGTLHADIPGVLVAVDGGGLRAAASREAKLGKAKFKSITFYGPDTICPDGKPAKDGVYDQTACRMKPPKY
ncbi:MAG: hypothetical protein LH650_05590 [Chloroflexi bacterium]|nr:hypothetical protein [Chloroflexota bacterium]